MQQTRIKGNEGENQNSQTSNKKTRNAGTHASRSLSTGHADTQVKTALQLIRVYILCVGPTGLGLGVESSLGWVLSMGAGFEIAAL